MRSWNKDEGSFVTPSQLLILQGLELIIVFSVASILFNNDWASVFFGNGFLLRKALLYSFISTLSGKFLDWIGTGALGYKFFCVFID